VCRLARARLRSWLIRLPKNTDPKLHPKIMVKRINRLDVLVIEVKESHDHLAAGHLGGPYIRVGRSTVKMGKDEYEHLILEKNKDRIRFDSSICEGAALKRHQSWFSQEIRYQRKVFERGLDLSEKLSVHETLDEA